MSWDAPIKKGRGKGEKPVKRHPQMVLGYSKPLLDGDGKAIIDGDGNIIYGSQK